MPNQKRSVLKNIFVLIYIITTVAGFLIGYFIYRDVKKDLIKDLSHTSSVIKSYYELSFKQWELSLLSVGLRLSEIEGQDVKQRQLDYANGVLETYDLLLAFGYADTTGQVLIFTGMGINDSLPHLMKSENSKRSFLEAKKASKLVIGEAYYFPPVNDWILPIRVPIRKKSGELIAVNTSAINYRAMNRELASFGIDPSYRIHLINDTFGTTQLYYPLDSSKYDQIIRMPASVYADVTEQASLGSSDYFNSFNSIENEESIGIHTKLSNLNHSLIVTVGAHHLWTELIRSARLLLIAYLTLIIGFVLLYRYFKNKQQEYLSSLETERANLKAIFESSTNIIGLWDTKQHLIEYNSAFESYSRIEGIELKRGMDVLSEMKQVEVANMFKEFQLRALKGEHLREIIEYPMGEDTLSFVFSYAPIYKGNEITGVSMFVDDITELKKSQKKLEEYNEKLEQMVKVRTEQIEAKNQDLELALNSLKETQGQLIQVEKMASLGILAAGIGHEINNPLNFIKNGINTMVNVLEANHPNINEEVEPFLNIVNEGVDRASKIVKSLSHFSRSGISMNEDCNIHDILDNCLVMLQSTYKLRIEVIKSYSSTPCILSGNDGKLHQAFLNILTNAGQAITGNGTITIFTERVGKKVKVRIRDTGSGISKENIKRVTDPFYTTKPPGEGTGLGMFITQSIIQEHSGIIEIESELGKGTEFSVTFQLP